MKKALIIISTLFILTNCSDKGDSAEFSKKQDTIINATPTDKKENKLVVTDCETLKTIFTEDSTNNSDTISFLKFTNITGFAPKSVSGQDTLIISGHIYNSSYYENCKSFMLDVFSKNNSHSRLYDVIIETDNNCKILRYEIKKYLNQDIGQTEMIDFFVLNDSLEKIIISHPTADHYTFKDYQYLKNKFMIKKR